MPNANATGRTGVRKGRGKGAALDRVLWTATGIALGAGIAIVIIGIYVKDLWT